MKGEKSPAFPMLRALSLCNKDTKFPSPLLNTLKAGDTVEVAISELKS
jgi:hypothetical protein